MKAFRRHSIVRHGLLAVALALSPLAAADRALPELGDGASLSLSVSEERLLGEELMRTVRRQLPLVDDLQVQHYLQELGQRLAAQADGPLYDYRFFLIDHPAINAFALPGGNIGMHTGLMLRAGRESELVAVLAHEIAHVTQRHLSRRLDAQRSDSLRTAGLLFMAILIGSQDPEAGSAALHTGLASSIDRQLAYSREHEREADLIGLRLMAAAGFDTRAMAGFFDQLQRAYQYQEEPPEYLSTHPVTADRIAETSSQARRFPVGTARESLLFDLMQTRLALADLPAGESAVEHFLARVAENPEHSGHRYGLALARIGQGQAAAAIADLHALIERDGDLSPYYLALGDALQAEGRLEEALAVFEFSLTLFPNHPAAVLAMANALDAQGDPDLAQQQLRGFLRGQPEQPILQQALARFAASAGQRSESRLAMAEYYRSLGRFDLALAQLDQVIDSATASVYDKNRAMARRQVMSAEHNRQRQ